MKTNNTKSVDTQVVGKIDVTKTADVANVAGHTFDSASQAEQNITENVSDSLLIADVLQLAEKTMAGASNQVRFGEYCYKLTGRGKSYSGAVSNEAFDAAIIAIVSAVHDIYKVDLEVPPSTQGRVARLAYAIFGRWPESQAPSGRNDTLAGKRVARAKMDYIEFKKLEEVKADLDAGGGKILSESEQMLADIAAASNSSDKSAVSDKVKNLNLATVANLMESLEDVIPNASERKMVRKAIYDVTIFLDPTCSVRLEKAIGKMAKARREAQVMVGKASKDTEY